MATATAVVLVVVEEAREVVVTMATVHQNLDEVVAIKDVVVDEDTPQKGKKRFVPCVEKRKPWILC